MTIDKVAKITIFFITVLVLSGAIADLKLMSFGQNAHARDFRSFNAIPKPGENKGKARKALDLKLRNKLLSPIPVPDRLIRNGVRKITQAWNRRNLVSYLDEDFRDASFLRDDLIYDLPRDLKIRVLGIRGSQTLSQEFQQKREQTWLVSHVAVSVRTQLEFNAVDTGYQKLQGEQEWVLKVEQSVTR